MSVDPRQGKPSASAIEQMFLCPGSRQAQEGQPEVLSDPQDSGVQIHAALAGDTAALLNLSSSDTRAYEEMNDQAYELVEQLGFDPDNYAAEERLWYENEFSGQSDRSYKNTRDALVIDFKSGFLPTTTASDNPQLATLGVLTLCNDPAIESVTVAIIPRFGRTKEIATYDVQAAAEALAHIREIIAAAAKPDAPRRPGDKQCKYCRAKLICPEFQARAMDITTTPKDQLPALPSVDLAKAIDLIPSINDLIKALKAEGKRRLETGDEEFAKLYRLADGRNIRTIIKLPTVFERALFLGITDFEFTAACNLDLGAVTKDGAGTGLKGLVYKVTGLKGVALDKRVDELIHDCVTECKTAGTLKRIKETT